MRNIETDPKPKQLQTKNIITKLLIAGSLLQIFVNPTYAFSKEQAVTKIEKKINLPNYITVRLKYYKTYWNEVKKHLDSSNIPDNMFIPLYNGLYYILDDKYNIHVFRYYDVENIIEYTNTYENVSLNFIYKKSDRLSGLLENIPQWYTYWIDEFSSLYFRNDKIIGREWVWYISTYDIINIIKTNNKNIDVSLRKRVIVDEKSEWSNTQ